MVQRCKRKLANSTKFRLSIDRLTTRGRKELQDLAHHVKLLGLF